jgi:membrane protease YdiL (CAAX protease family)
VIAALAGPRFCSACGAPWQSDRLTCAACEQKSAASAVAVAQDRTPVRAGSAIGLYFALLGASMIGLISALSGAPVDDVLVFTSAAHALIVIVWSLVERRSVLRLLAWPAPGWWFLIAPLVAGCTFIFAATFLQLLSHATHLARLHVVQDLLNSGYGMFAVIVLICVMPGLFEELAFRGVIIEAFRPALSQREVILVSALMFMVLHVQVGMFPHTLLLGLVLGWMRFRSGSLLPGILLHFTHNLLSVLLEHHWG